MKKTFLITLYALLAASALAQTPAPPTQPNVPPLTPTVPPVTASAPTLAPTAPVITATPVAAVTPFATVTPLTTVTPFPTATPAATMATATPDVDDQIDDAIEKKISSHFNFTTGNRHHHSDDNDDDVAWIALPIVFIVFMAIFGAPILIVAVILYFSFSKNRAMHKTVRLMVEKGQPVPEALLNPPPVVRQRSDLRRGIKWLLVGLGIMIFFGACSDWDGGAWSIGIIPFMIGVGYLIFWRLGLREEENAPKV